MPYQQLIMFSFFLQAGHSILSAMHLWLVLQGAGLGFNIFMVLFNLTAFLLAASWRGSLRRHAAQAQRRRDFFRR